jgi:hypothetical protein
MKAAKVVLGLAVVLALVLVVGAQADEKAGGKEVKLMGTLVCGKCTLGETAKCANVLKVKEGDKTVNYYLDDKGNKESYHKKVCPPNSEAEAIVIGSVTEKDGKKWLKPTKVDLK